MASVQVLQGPPDIFHAAVSLRKAWASKTYFFQETSVLEVSIATVSTFPTSGVIAVAWQGLACNIKIACFSSTCDDLPRDVSPQERKPGEWVSIDQRRC